MDPLGHVGQLQEPQNKLALPAPSLSFGLGAIVNMSERPCAEEVVQVVTEGSRIVFTRGLQLAARLSFY